MRRLLVPVGLALLVLVNAVLAYAMLRPSGTQVGAPIPVAPQTPTEPTPTPTGSEPGSAGGETRLVFPVDETSAWRVLSTGPCRSGSASIERTRDGGSTWTPVAGPKGLRAASWLNISGLSPRLTGLGADCTPAQWVRVGDGWRSADTARAWAIAATSEGPGKVTAPNGREIAACQTRILDLAPFSQSSAYALCEGGNVMSIRDDGARSVYLRSNTILAIAAVESQPRLVLVRSEPSCGLQVARYDGQMRPVSCLPNSRGRNGPVDISFAGQRGWAVVGSTTWRGSLEQDSWRQSAPSPSSTDSEPTGTGPMDSGTSTDSPTNGGAE